MNILITGVAGFIGSHLADALLAEGHAVSGIDNLETGRLSNVPPAVTFTLGDIVQPHQWPDGNFDLIVHCAASYSDPNKWHRDTDTNVKGTINAIIKARECGARIVYFQTALPPISSYAISKIAGEHYIAQSGVPHLIFRLANMYGPRNVSGPIPTFYRRLKAGEPCTVVRTRRDMVYVGDLVELVLRGIESDTVGKWDACSGMTNSIGTLYLTVRDELGLSESAKSVAPASDDVDKMELDPFPTHREFGWRATTSLGEGVSAAVAWYDEHGVTDTYTHLVMK